MMATSRLNNENEFMIPILRFNKSGFDESSPYINIRGLDESSPYTKKKMGMINQTHTELIIMPGGY